MPGSEKVRRWMGDRLHRAGRYVRGPTHTLAVAHSHLVGTGRRDRSETGKAISSVRELPLHVVSYSLAPVICFPRNADSARISSSRRADSREVPSVRRADLGHAAALIAIREIKDAVSRSASGRTERFVPRPRAGPGPPLACARTNEPEDICRRLGDILWVWRVVQ
jgi:hypothetical protein